MLRTALGPAIAGYLEDPSIVEVMLNPDGRIWIDRLSGGLIDRLSGGLEDTGQPGHVYANVRQPPPTSLRVAEQGHTVILI